MWDAMLLGQLFCPQEIDVILSIPLSIMDVRDKLIRHFERDGRFSVGSAYHIARSDVESGNEAAGASASNGQVGNLWRKLWKACVSNKVKIYAWRSCCDALPTRNNLAKRKVTQDDGCLFCVGKPKTIEHVFEGLLYGSSRVVLLRGFKN